MGARTPIFFFFARLRCSIFFISFFQLVSFLSFNFPVFSHVFSGFLLRLHLINYTFRSISMNNIVRWPTCMYYDVCFYSYLAWHTLIVKVKCLLLFVSSSSIQIVPFALPLRSFRYCCFFPFDILSTAINWRGGKCNDRDRVSCGMQ